jgi:hypothetical protein
MNIPGFSAEASLGRMRGQYKSWRAQLGTKTEAKIVPQLPRVLWETCTRVSPYYSACGCVDDEIGVSYTCIVRA